MKFKDLIIPISLALLISAGLQYFFGTRDEAGKAAQTSQVFEIAQPTDPNVVQLHADDYELDFIEEKAKQKATVTTVPTPYGTYYFTTDGGALEKVEYIRTENNNTQTFNAFTSQGTYDKMFLIALNEKTPYFYQLKNHIKLDDKEVITYEASYAGGSIVKEFTVFKNVTQVDLKVSLNVNTPSDQGLRARLLFQSPHFESLATKDTARAFFDEQGSVRVYSNLKELTNKLIGGPINLLGLDDRYYVFSLIKDPQQMFQRAYFRKLNDSSLLALLQSHWIKKSDSWNLSFYVGPKQVRSFATVDPRLDDILDYGWFAPLSKLLLKLLQWIVEYVKNYGLAIILLTILLKLLLLPFTWKSEQQLRGMGVQRDDLNRKLAYLKERYKDDPQALARERADLVRKHGMPGIGGCLPLLVQFPIFIALNRVLSSSLDLYQTPFLWIKNLAAPDPYYILPVIVAAGIVLHRPSASKDPKQGLMPYAMALVFGAITMQLAAGLVIFILTNTLTGVVQSQITKLFKRS